MRTSDSGNADALVVLLNRLKRANNVVKLPPHKRRAGKMLNDCIESMVQSIEGLKGKSGAARVVHGHFSGHAASVLHRRLTKEFLDVANASGGASRSSKPAVDSERAAPVRGYSNGGRNVDNNNNAAVPRFDRRADVCFACGKVGHMARDCRIKQER